MQSKLTPELSQALDRAIDAAASDPLVEALEALRRVEAKLTQCARAFYVDGKASALRAAFQDWRSVVDPARLVLAKYRPTLSDSDTPKS